MRKQEERPSHELWSFARYLNKVFAFRSASDRLTVSLVSLVSLQDFRSRLVTLCRY